MPVTIAIADPDRGDIIRVGVAVDGELVVSALPADRRAPGLQDGRTLEITRVCTLGSENACSRLYGALCRAAKALGWQRVYTYTLVSEPGSSLKAAGFVIDAQLAERDWSLGKTDGFGRYHTNLFGEQRSLRLGRSCDGGATYDPASGFERA